MVKLVAALIILFFYSGLPLDISFDDGRAQCPHAIHVPNSHSHGMPIELRVIVCVSFLTTGLKTPSFFSIGVGLTHASLFEGKQRLWLVDRNLFFPSPTPFPKVEVGW